MSIEQGGIRYEWDADTLDVKYAYGPEHRLLGLLILGESKYHLKIFNQAEEQFHSIGWVESLTAATREFSHYIIVPALPEEGRAGEGSE